jgi:hypothetical protein
MSASPARDSSRWEDDPARDPDAPVPTPDWMTEEEWRARCAAEVGDEPLEFEDDYWFGGDAGEVIAEAEQAAADEAAAAAHIAELGQTAAMAAAGARRRGPGQPGSASLVAGVYSGPGGGFGTGQALDPAPGGGMLLVCAEKAAGEDGRFTGCSDDELAGIIAASDRAEASAAGLELAAVAALIRRRPAAGCRLEGEAQMPADWDEFTERELAALLGESPHAMETSLQLAHDLEVKLPGTMQALRSGVITKSKAQIIATGCRPLGAAEARAAEAMVLGRAPGLTPGSLRAAISRAVMQVNPEKAKKRREEARKQARVEVWPEPSGNGAVEARELPVAEAVAIDQRISWWARQLKTAGLEGSTDQLRAQAFADLILARDSRPGHAGERPPTAGFAATATLTIPAATVLGLADRPGEFGVLGPVDPWLARDLAAAAAQNPRTSWCVTVTDKDGHAVAHGCARPEARSQRKPGPGQDTNTGTGTGFSLTREDRRGPPGGYGSWRLHTPGPGPDLLLDVEPLTTDPCDHRHQAHGHDPGVTLKHLTRIRYARCTAPACRRPAAQCDYEHNTPYEAGGRTCLCNGSPKCRHDHRLKQHPQWKVEQRPDGTFRWTAPSGRSYQTEPTRYPV